MTNIPSPLPDASLNRSQDNTNKNNASLDSQPQPKRATVRPTHKLPEGFRPRYWALWKYEWKRSEGKEEWELAKPTYSPHTLRKFKWKEEGGHWEESLRKGLWGSFEEVVKAYEANEGSFDGYGYVVEPDVPLPDTDGIYYIVTDHDGCCDEHGRVASEVRGDLEAQDTFTELSPSGEGLHQLGVGRKPPGSKMVFQVGDRRIENYGGDVGGRRFMAYTGVPLEGYDKPIANVQRWIDENVPTKGNGSKVPTIDCGDLAPDISGNTQNEIVRICGGIKHEDRGRLFNRLFFEGDWSPWASRSQAEIWLLNLFAWATFYLIQDEAERKAVIKILFEGSVFFRTGNREQWGREGYVEGQIDVAIRDCTSGYTGKPKEQILRRIEAFRIDADWKLGGNRDNANARAMFGAHIALAYDHGRFARAGESVLDPKGMSYPIPETGVLVHSSARDLSVFSGIRPTATEEDGEKRRDYRNITKVNDRLAEKGFIRRIYRGDASGKASLYLLPKALDASHDFTPSLTQYT